jgi:hypothetical protein
MSADVLLSRLDRVRRVGHGRWVACCPCHESRSKSSLSVSETADGRVLVKDHGGCGTADVLTAVGLDFDALFPARIDASREARGGSAYRSAAARPLHAMQVLLGLHDDLVVAATVIGRALEGNATDDDAAALYAVAGRVADSLEGLRGVR